MLRKTPIFMFLIAPAIATASVLETLKDTPASKYEVGKLQLELGALMLTDKLGGERVRGTDFDIKKFSVDEKSNGLRFIMSFIGDTKSLTTQQCESFHKTYSANFSPVKMMHDLWPELSAEEYQQLEQELKFSVELISEDNVSIKIEC